MNPIFIKKFLNLILNKNLINLFYVFFFISLIFIFLAIYFQPFAGDDLIIEAQVLDSINFSEYFNNVYTNWSARFSFIFISYWIYSDNLNLVLYKLSIIPLFLVTFYFFLR